MLGINSLKRAGMAAMAVVLLVVAGIGLNNHLIRADNGTMGQETPDEIDLLNGVWQLPGAAKITGGLAITPNKLKIVNQDGSGGQPDPPINAAGTHLERVSGDFGARAVVQGLDGRAVVQLYGELPVIQDEFRIERKSLRMSITSDTLEISLWDGVRQNSNYTYWFRFPAAAEQNVAVEKRGQRLYFWVNGQQVGKTPAREVFNSGKVWFGLDAPLEGSSWKLARLTARPLDSGTIKVAGPPAPITKIDHGQMLQGLADVKRPGFKVGAAMALYPAAGDPEYAQAAFNNFGQMTTENALKWQAVHPSKDLYTFENADALVALAKQNGLDIHGHTLVFGEANPRWVQQLPTAAPADKAAVQKVMTDHIAAVMGHYKGQIATWDVVNEPLDDDGQLRDTKWSRAMGEQYMDIAFTAAHQTDPGAKLFINMYGAEAEGDMWDGLYALVARLKARGVPLDGVGLQSHVYEAGDRIDPAVLRKHIHQLAALGLQVRISEMDVYDDDGQSVQAAQYAGVFEACLEEPACMSFTTWGVSDRYDMFKDDDGRIEQGHDFLFDTKMQPVPAYDRIKQVLLG